MFSKQLAGLLSLSAVALGVTIPVEVGNGGLTFNPPSVTAAIGDLVSFTFYPKNHTVTQSTFAQPCVRAAAGGQLGADSGYKPTAAGTTTPAGFVVNVTTDRPLWFYCAQGNHCTQGMVFAINAPATGNTFEAFRAIAMGQAPPPTATSTTITPGVTPPVTPPVTGGTPPVTGGTPPVTGGTPPVVDPNGGGVAPVGGVGEVGGIGANPASTTPGAPGATQTPPPSSASRTTVGALLGASILGALALL